MIFFINLKNSRKILATIWIVVFLEDQISNSLPAELFQLIHPSPLSLPLEDLPITLRSSVERSAGWSAQDGPDPTLPLGNRLRKKELG